MSGVACLVSRVTGLESQHNFSSEFLPSTEGKSPIGHIAVVDAVRRDVSLLSGNDEFLALFGRVLLEF